ncbi:hypothetical protein EV361DRAFT_605902 [Lentinula raphanica]|uniref:Zn(2)-C6 fungal-type domain-containing protein n=1 Tax=Lentinula raphanica TaxID=153919 RepID=A0AA38UMV0_9AGAR|nr:hypothetical protein C8R42DRAFT_461536 [Lentinula raphanica]KAJ3778656.1 hypothetical protein FB446DRAFT_398051 [Lentinula raphanica]KAJ3844592.1 hypothetical protein F5878DRAFT_720575 [Lentinula raphanica]KAJ3965985.1 hypothetical protein EV361DRAFT_605902 [Lentinula raphanica]
MMSYSPQTHYLPQPPLTYYPSPPLPQPHVATPQTRQETSQQRKRPKYTRSKTGCLTCRVKKIKCDEAKPTCARCLHGQRDCTWPEGVPARKKSTARKDSLDTTDGRPSTAGSSISEGSTPPTRDRTPPRSQPLERDLPPLASRRTSDPYLQLHPLPSSEPLSLRRHGSSDRFAYAPSGPSPNLLNPLPEHLTYAHPHRYDHAYVIHPAGRHIIGPGVRPAEHIPPSGHWHVPPMLAPVHVEPYYPSLPVRMSPTQEQQPHRY